MKPCDSDLFRRYTAGERDFVDCDFSAQDLSGLKFGDGGSFRKCNFEKVNLSKSSFGGCIMLKANFQEANLDEIEIFDGYWDGSDFRAVSLRNATIAHVDMMDCFFGQANLSGIRIMGVNFHESIMFGVDLTGADLSMANGLSETNKATSRAFVERNLEVGPRERELLANIVDEAALNLTVQNFALRAEILSQLKDPSLRMFAEINDIVEFLGSTKLSSERILQFRESCRRSSNRPGVFISYSSKDTAAVERLHKLFSKTGISVWFAPEEMKAGGEISEQLNRAIDLFDYIVPVLSKHSVGSRWVNHEVVRAKRREQATGKAIVHPVRIVDYEDLDAWKVIDPDTGEDYAEQLRRLFIPDFSMWNDAVALQNAFVKFARDLNIV